MTTRANGLAGAVILSLLLALLAGCSGQDPKSSPRPAAADAPDKALTKGTCWDDTQLPDELGANAFDDWVETYAAGDSALADSMRDDASFSKLIECTEPHELELYNVVELEPSLTAKVTKYADLLDQKSPLYRAIRDQVNERCPAGSAYDVAQRGARGPRVQLGPTLNTGGGLHMAWDPFPADLWAKGERKFVCIFEQDEPGTMRFADLVTRKVPVTARVCLMRPGRFVPCAGKHDAEDIAEVLLNTLIAKGQIDGRKALRKGVDGPYVAFSDALYAKLDKVCQTFMSSVSTLKGGVVAKVYPGSVKQWPTPTGEYVARCFALKPDEEPPAPITGTIFNKG